MSSPSRNSKTVGLYKYIKEKLKWDEVFERRRLGKTETSLVRDAGWDMMNATLTYPVPLALALIPIVLSLLSVIWQRIHMSGGLPEAIRNSE